MMLPILGVLLSLVATSHAAPASRPHIAQSALQAASAEEMKRETLASLKDEVKVVLDPLEGLKRLALKGVEKLAVKKKAEALNTNTAKALDTKAEALITNTAKALKMALLQAAASPSPTTKSQFDGDLGQHVENINGKLGDLVQKTTEAMESVTRKTHSSMEAALDEAGGEVALAGRQVGDAAGHVYDAIDDAKSYIVSNVDTDIVPAMNGLREGAGNNMGNLVQGVSHTAELVKEWVYRIIDPTWIPRD
jgi:hypothetical protein